jgi:alkylated DNA repair protein (DNA oxidative demethylase)
MFFAGAPPHLTAAAVALLCRNGAIREIACMNAFPAGFRHLPRCLDEERQRFLLAELRDVIATSPLFTPTMPRTGKAFSVRMTNCGTLGWVSDRQRGYRYQPSHPATGAPWPPMPEILLALWRQLAGYPAPPEACLVNYYAAGTRMGSHVDADEQDFSAPVLSVSLGDDAMFHVGGRKRTDPKERIRLGSGDVVVLGGASRRCYHGIDRVLAGTSTLLPEGGRINLTLRRVTPA